MDSNSKLSIKEKISYGIGDTACNLMYTVVTAYLTFYFTDVFGLNVVDVGVLMFASRIVDTFDSPIFGILIDKTNTRWGKSRPWILWFCIPFSVASVLLFANPNFSYGGKLIYAYIMYICVNVLYAAVNNPLTTMLPSLTDDTHERTVANTFRMVGGQVGALIVNLSLLSLVSLFGQGNKSKGFFSTMSLFSVIGLIMLLITFFNTREKIKVKDSDKANVSVKDSIIAIKYNKPWIITVLVSIVAYIIYTSRATAAIYYLTYYIKNEGAVSLVNSLGTTTIIGMLLVPTISKYMAKRNMIMIGNLVAITGQVIIYLGKFNISVICIGTVVASIGLGVVFGILFSLLADTVDYGEWKTGIRTEGILAATGSGVGIKLGSGLGAAIPAWIMAKGGYIAGAVQSSTAINSIIISYIFLPVLMCIVSIILLLFLKFEKPIESIIEELSASR
ncbi:MFS transporter [Clostridium scatologenes]|uniref:Sugar (Glycoside-Pentoside-Hexuronide) transporter n=1 Tax=Clostridium scatologenes TaxID=1548 RepID=A0A0E3JZH4_CLOSL|nr:MFS transporter [Clostridium scatologenes]AKA69662.1 sugar (glycoside-Pentoside-Hexuronide) transporter [Clostridium scatologenes]